MALFDRFCVKTADWRKQTRTLGAEFAIARKDRLIGVGPAAYGACNCDALNRVALFEPARSPRYRAGCSPRHFLMTFSNVPSSFFPSCRSAPTVTEASHGQVFHRLPRFAPYLFHNVSGGRLKRGGEGYGGAKSLSNPNEVFYITSLLQ